MNSVGKNVGDIANWEVSSREKTAQRTFKVWDITTRSMLMQVSVVYFNGIELYFIIRNIKNYNVAKDNYPFFKVAYRGLFQRCILKRPKCKFWVSDITSIYPLS